jgi:hypothetical protein
MPRRQPVEPWGCAPRSAFGPTGAEPEPRAQPIWLVSASGKAKPCLTSGGKAETTNEVLKERQSRDGERRLQRTAKPRRRTKSSKNGKAETTNEVFKERQSRDDERSLQRTAKPRRRTNFKERRSRDDERSPQRTAKAETANELQRTAKPRRRTESSKKRQSRDDERTSKNSEAEMPNEVFKERLSRGDDRGVR